MTSEEAELCATFEAEPNLAGYQLLVKMIALRTCAEAGVPYGDHHPSSLRLVDRMLIAADAPDTAPGLTAYIQRFEQLLRIELKLPPCPTPPSS